jgi:hypothetical protein
MKIFVLISLFLLSFNVFAQQGKVCCNPAGQVVPGIVPCPTANNAFKCCTPSGQPVPSLTSNPKLCKETTSGGTSSGATSGACCMAKPNANPVHNCADPMLNLGHPQGVYYGYQRCVQANMGASCEWNTTNPKCCAAGVPGCCPEGSATATYNALIAGGFLNAAEKCKQQMAAAGASDPSTFKCCLEVRKDVLSEKCKASGGTPVQAASCSHPTPTLVFGPVYYSNMPYVCCKK